MERCAVAARVAHGSEMEPALARLSPHLLILDVNLPELDAAAVTPRLVKRHPQLHILVLTACDDQATIFSLLQAGVIGYALKEEPPANLLSAIRTVAGGHTWLSSRLARLLVNRAVAAWQPSQDLPTLTRRELEVLILIGQGLSNPQIAQALCITRHTVRSHIKRINSKLGLDRRSQVVRYAIEHGLASAPSEQYP